MIIPYTLLYMGRKDRENFGLLGCLSQSFLIFYAINNTFYR